MFELTVHTHFDAAHMIRSYPGKCAQLHGHSWAVEVVIQGRKLNELGMLVDFSFLKKEVNNIIEQLDHQYLNELPHFDETNPTSEHLAQLIFNELKAPVEGLEDDLKLYKVVIWESPRASAAYFEG